MHLPGQRWRCLLPLGGAGGTHGAGRAGPSRRLLLPFHEAHFSNFIEGTEFTLDEAAHIVFEHTVPGDRPADAHDVLGTYQIAATASEMRRTPYSGREFLELLRSLAAPRNGTSNGRTHYTTAATPRTPGFASCCPERCPNRHS